ncbi:MAG: NAD(P)/FAD-dependent oxidoreductase [Chitinophagales bacterium]
MDSNQTKSNDLIVVGGGITGLSAAYIAAKAGKKVTVIEAGKSFGGLLNTFEIGNNRLEHYYHHFFTHDKELNWLIKELGLSDKLFFKKTSMGVYRGGEIYDFNTPFDLLKFSPITLIDKIKFGFTSLFLGKFADWRKYEHISCLEWFKKWSGKSTTSSLWLPMLNIKFGPYASKVPLSWMIGRLRQRMNSRKSGDERLGYLEGSLQVLLDKLLAELKNLGVELISGEPLQKVNTAENRISGIETTKQEYKSSKYLFTIPGNYLSEIIKPNLPDLSTQLANIKYFGAICIILELKHKLSDTYWLNVADEGFPFGGIIEHTNFIPPENYNGSHIAYLSRYFAMEENIAKMNEDEVKSMMISHLPKIYPGFKESWLKNIFIFRTNTAATVCDLNFSGKIPNCKTAVENMFIVNMSHVYPDERSTNNSIKIASEACNAMGIKNKITDKTNSLAGKIGFKK